jgi:hypothetical protein
MLFSQLAKWQFFQLRGLAEQHAHMENWTFRKIQPKFYDPSLQKCVVNCRIIKPQELVGVEFFYHDYQRVEAVGGPDENNCP